MLIKLRTLASLYRELGPRWLAFRLAYVFRLRTGGIRQEMPQYKWEDRQLETWLQENIPTTPEAYAHWRKENSPRFFFDSFLAERRNGYSFHHSVDVPWNQQLVVNEAERALNGELIYFFHDFVHTGFPPHWHQDPFSKIHVDSSKHWSQIFDDTDVDIKFVWEANRFNVVYTLVRAYAVAQDEIYAEAFWKLVLNWGQHNLPNAGANWMDGQEITLRLMAWIFGYYAFLNSPSSIPERITLFTVLIAAQAERIYKNIDYAISTRSNHTISEAMGLWLVGLLFPELKDSEKYRSLGRKLLEQEAAQIFPDGSYSMYSLNYHRFILHIYLYAMRLGELHKDPFSESVQCKVSRSIEYLTQLINSQTGEMPVYGSNDGALVLPLNNCDFTDYRPLLQLGWHLTKKEFLFKPGAWDEDLFWLCGVSRAERSCSDSEGIVEARRSKPSFPHGGTYLLHNTDSHVLIRCTDFTARPSHADQLHMDLWIHGHNIAVDAGTYLYSGEGIWRNGLAHTSAHNTVTVDNKDQMTMISRFTWINWSKGKVLKHNKNLWQGEHDGYKPVSHKRTVMALDGDRWLVIDNLVANESHHYVLHWLLADFGIQKLASGYGLCLSQPTSELVDSKIKIQMGTTEGNDNFSLVRADPNSTRGWRSRYYGHKEPAISVMLEANQPQVTFWTFFGYENDVVEIEGNELRINSKKIMLVE